MATEVINNDAYTVVTSGGSDAPAVGTVETFVVASPGEFQTVLAYYQEQMHIVDLTSSGHIKGGEIMLVTDMWATQLTSALTGGTPYSSLAVDAIPAAMSINDQLVLNNGSGDFDVTYLAANASMGATSLSLWSGAVPTIVSSSAAVTTSSSSLTITAPTGLIPGNLLIAVIVNSTGSDASTPPEGWSVQNRFPLGSMQVDVYSWILTDDEPSSYTFTTTAANNSGILFQVQGCLNGYFSIYCAGVSTGTSFTTQTPTTTYNNCLLVLVAADTGGDTFTISSGPMGITNAHTTAVSSIYAWSVTDSTAGVAPSYTITPSASDTGTTLTFVFNPQQEFTPANNYSIGAVVADTTTAAANVNWTVTRGAEPMVPAVQGLSFPASTPQTVTHNTSWVATNSITLGALMNYVENQPEGNFNFGTISCNNIYTSIEYIYGYLYMQDYSSIQWVSEAGYPYLSADPTVGSLTFWGPAYSTGWVDTFTILNGAIGIGATVPAENGTVASAPPASAGLHTIFTEIGGGGGGIGMALVAVSDVEETIGATPTGWVDYNGTDGGYWESSDGLDVALIALDGSGATATWTASDGSWETLGLLLTTTTTPALVQDSNGLDLSFVETSPTLIFESPTTSGNAVAICFFAIDGTDVTDVTSNFGTFTRVNGVGVEAPPFGLEWWVCSDISTQSDPEIEVTTTSGYGAAPVALEISGGVTAVADGGNNSGTSTTPTLTVTAPGGGGGVTGNFPLNTPWLNPLDYDILVMITMTTFTAIGEPTVSAGVGPTSPPSQTLVLPVVNQLATYCLTFKVPAGYYLEITNTGTLNDVVTQAWAQPA